MSWRVEPSIEELLSEPVVCMVMARDGVTPCDVRRAVEDARTRLSAGHHIARSAAPTNQRGLAADDSAEAVQAGGGIDENELAHGMLRNPVRQQIEVARVVPRPERLDHVDRLFRRSV
jgi:hypothetical protein